MRLGRTAVSAILSDCATEWGGVYGALTGLGFDHDFALRLTIRVVRAGVRLHRPLPRAVRVLRALEHLGLVGA